MSSFSIGHMEPVAFLAVWHLAHACVLTWITVVRGATGSKHGHIGSGV